MNEQRIQAIKDSLREVMAILAQRGQPISEDVKLMLARVMEHAATRIQQLRQEDQEEAELERMEAEQEQVSNELAPQMEEKKQGAAPIGGNVPLLEPAPHQSSNINSLKYDPSKKQLYIKFMGKETADSGPIYSYSGVEKNIFDVILRGGIAPITSGKNKYHEWFRGITPSHGASVNALLVKGQYPYTRIS